MAETNGYVAQSPPMPVGDRCIGWVMPPVRHRIVDESGRDVPGGAPGELLLAGPTIATDYWNDPDETAAHFEDGWFRSGDIVRRGRLRMLYFVDRSRDLIKSGGYKIAAAEVDNVVEAHSAVLHAATVGVPHEQLGEEAVTAVVLRPGTDVSEAELLRWARGRLASAKCPRRIVFVGSLPLTVSLKPKRREVQAMLTRRTVRAARAQ
jgi:acyl-CoA synthetase (AMP-forming)/AMP-acid ligase II